MPVPEPISGATSGVTRKSGEEMRDTMLKAIDWLAWHFRTSEYSDWMPGTGFKCDPEMGEDLDGLVENCHELLAIVNIQKDMMRG